MKYNSNQEEFLFLYPKNLVFLNFHELVVLYNIVHIYSILINILIIFY
jgi:hypothetical protein